MNTRTLQFCTVIQLQNEVILSVIHPAYLHTAGP